MELFALASTRNHWLSAKLAVIAGNVANATTPGYRAREISPFREVMENRAVTLARTNPAHLNTAGAEGPAPVSVREREGGPSTFSGNNVSLEKEMLEGAETVRAYRLNTNLVRAYHRMFLLALKEG